MAHEMRNGVKQQRLKPSPLKRLQARNHAKGLNQQSNGLLIWRNSFALWESILTRFDSNWDRQSLAAVIQRQLVRNHWADWGYKHNQTLSDQVHSSVHGVPCIFTFTPETGAEGCEGRVRGAD
ncbi:MAG: hypothetical protein H7Y37_17690 [Anaerolineae bacterium]|nr:hypothetical protein [Gloeobacterales cyanobacterium ES-bin-313]